MSGDALLARAYEVVRHDQECPSIRGNGDWNCECDAVPFLRDLKDALTAPDAVRELDAIDADNGFRIYPWTYKNQPGNVGAWALGRACMEAARLSAGDPIDRGLGLLKTLHAEGFGIVRVARPQEGGE